MAQQTEQNGPEKDPARWGLSRANIAEVIVGCLDAIGATSVAEVGAATGDLTRFLLDWAAPAGARVITIEEATLDALRGVPHLDAAIIDGDHNYYTVSRALRLIDEKARAEIPLLMLNDVGWPYGRRDAYRAPERIPEEKRQPAVKRAFVFPGQSGVVEDGMPIGNAAKHEGGPRNGVLTAIEDFVNGREDLRLAIVPPFFGLAVVWRRDAPWAPAVAELLEPWDRNPVLERLEANRVFHLATSHARSVKLLQAALSSESQQEERAKLGRIGSERAAEPGAPDDSAAEAATIRWFHELWFRRRPVFASTFLGITAWQNPLDAWITQEIVSEVRPDLIIETGTFKGGSAALWASLLEVANPAGRVVSIDVDDARDPRATELDVVKRRVEFLHGSSTDPDVVRDVTRRAAGGKVIAILDSNHDAEHVFEELRAYAPLITLGSYLIVQDVRAGPDMAIERFLEQDDRFEPDRVRERFMITNCTRGFLRRTH